MTEGWSTRVPAQPTVWDASRLSLVMTCWRKHWYRTVRGLQARERGHDDVHTEFGTLYHAAVELFDRACSAGASPEEATDQTIEWLLAATWEWPEIPDPEAPDCFFLDKSLPGKPWGGEIMETWRCTDASRRGRCEWAKQANVDMPMAPGPDGALRCGSCSRPVTHGRHYEGYHKRKHRVNLLRAVLLYCDKSKEIQPYQFPDGEPAIEVLARVPLPIKTPEGDHYELVTNVDSFVEFDGDLLARERKTTSLGVTRREYWDQFEPNVQVDTYDLMTFLLYADEEAPSAANVLVEAMEIGVGYCRLRRRPIYVPPGRMAEWLEEIQAWIKEAEQRARRSARGEPLARTHPRNTTACITNFGHCQFLSLCRLDPERREAYIIEAYEVNRWNPLEKK